LDLLELRLNFWRKPGKVLLYGDGFWVHQDKAGIFIFEITNENMEKNLTIAQAQELVDQWIKTVGVRYFNELTNMTILMEEVGELARIMSRTYGEQSFKESDKGKDLGDEMADVLWVLICLANQTGVDLTQALQKNFEKKNIRDLDRHKNNEKLR
jgi:NTP pyrophosphatase (non-canonical NTP hydrolase)